MKSYYRVYMPRHTSIIDNDYILGSHLKWEIRDWLDRHAPKAWDWMNIENEAVVLVRISDRIVAMMFTLEYA